jgi:tetratricopeptide (TPR) repeat protein
LGPTPIKGVRDPLRVFALEGFNTRFRTARSHSVSGLVGRHQELAILEDALARAGEGERQIIGIVGEAGVGKSRLCEEFCASVAQRGITVRRTAGVSHGLTVPLLPVLSLIRDYFEIDDSMTPAEVRAKVGARILELAPDVAGDLPLFFDFIEVPDPAAPAPALSPEVRMRRVFEMLGEITASRSAEGLFVFLLEDLQWFDPQSVVFYELMVETLPGSRTLVLTNYRPGVSTAWMQEPFFRELPLEPLREDAVGELVGEMLGVDPSLAPLVGFVSERTGGNPYFVEEVVRALLENGTVTGEPGKYQLTCALDQIKIPPSVHSVVAARIDRLQAAQKTLMQTASVIGRTFPQPVLAQVAELHGQDLDEALQALCEAQLLEAVPGSTERAYRFWQAVTQEVAYGTLLAGRRKALHAAVAEALAAEAPDRLDETAAMLAWHWQRADRRLEAARWGVRAANFGLRSDLVDSLRRFQAAVDLLDGIDETPETLALGVRARIRLLQFGARIGIGPEEAHRLFAEAHERAERSGDLGLRGMSTIAYGATLAFAGDVVGGLERCIEAAHLGEQSEDLNVRATLLLPVCFARSYVGPLPEALRAAERVIEVCDGDEARGATVLGHGVLARALQFRGSILARMGRLTEATVAVERSVEIARRRNESETLVWALALYAQLPWLAGHDTDPAPAAEAQRVAEDSGNITGLVLALRSVAVTHLAAGSAAEAMAACERALEEGRRSRSGLFEEAPVLAVLARARLAAGITQGANAAADEAVAVARSQRAQVTEAQVLLARAHVRRASGMAPAEVRADLDAASAVIGRSGARMFEPFVVEERARLDGDAAGLLEAQRLFAEAGAAGHAARLEREAGGEPRQGSE